MGELRQWLVSLWMVALIPTIGPGLDISSSPLLATVWHVTQRLSSASPKTMASPTVTVPNHPNSTAGAAPAHPASSSVGDSPGVIPAASQEIPALRTQTSDSYSVSGGYELISYSSPVNYKSAQGSWQPIDDSLVASNASGFAWQNKANSFSVLLPSNLGAGPVEFKDASGSVNFQLQGASSAAGQVSGSTVTYTNAIPGVTVQITAGNAGIKESVILTGSTSPSQVSYSMTLGSGMNAAASAGGGVAITGQSGNLLYSIDAPIASDASGAAAPSVSISISGAGSSRTVSLSLDSTWLASSGRQWPVTIDPSINYNADQACEIENGSHANNNYCGSGTYLKVGYEPSSGYVHRSAMLFNIQNSIPVGAQVTHAGLAVYLNSTGTTNYGSVSDYQLTQAWTTSVTWNDYNGSTAWTNAGGTFNSTALASQTPSTAGWYYWHGASTAGLAQSWLNNPSSNDGLVLTADSETNNEVDTFGSGRVGSAPYFYVYYVNAIGQHPTYTMETHQLTDRSSLGVNVANGNLTLQASDLNIQGTGLPLTISRVYNSLGQGGAFGTWLMTPGVDENLTFYDSVNAMFQGPGGYAVNFYWTGSAYTPAPGVEANLVKNGGGTYTLTYNATGEQLNFNSAGVLTSDVDRNGDTISFTTASGDVTSISDTQSRSTTLSYSSPVASNLISGITDSTSRTWGYSYQSANGFNELIQYTDPNSKLTQYSYDTSGRVTQITDPLSNETKFAYDSSSRVTSITYVTDNVHGTGPTTNYTYNTGAGSCGTPPSGETYFGNTVSENADGYSTTYCYDPQGQVIETIDPNSHAQQVNFTSDQQTASSTDALSNVTTLTHDSNSNLTQTTLPAGGSGQTAPSTSSVFSTSGQPFLPSSSTDFAGNCSAYFYDSAGRLTDVYSDQSSGCSGTKSGTHISATYQGDPGVTSCGGKPGQLCSTTDAHGNTTTNAYDSNGNQTSVTPPSPLGATTRTFDSLSRVLTVTDGNGNKTTFTYDKLDRMTQLLYGGVTTCSSYSTCTQYNFDADGNLSSQIDITGTTSYYYDALNRLTTESLSTSGAACSGSSPSGITFTYDGVGNETSYCDSGGTVTYGYDHANRPTSMYEPGGSCGSTPSLCTTFAYNGDNQRTTTTFPGGATLNLGYDNTGNITSVIGKDKNSNTLTSFTYTYSNTSSVDLQLRQTMTESDAVASNTYTYTYDTSNRLTHANVTGGSGTSYTYAYDSSGNITGKTAGSTTSSYAYNAVNELCWAYSGSSSNACSSAPTGATTYSFDSNGNETASSSSDSLSYNSKNQTTSITHGGTTLSSLAYSGGDQTNRTAAGSTTFGNGPSGTQVATASGASTYYLRDSQGDEIGEKIGSNHYYYLTDNLGSIVAVISGDGLTVSNRYGYDSYGNTTFHSGSVSNPWGYAGGYTDATGFIKFGARYYDPSLGRWTQTDPLSQSQGSSQYQYAFDNPVNGVDPSGTWCCFGWNGYHFAWWGTYGTVWFYLTGREINAINDWGRGITALIGLAIGLRIGGARGALIGGLIGFLLSTPFLFPLNWASWYGAYGAWVDIHWYQSYGYNWGFGWYDAHR